MKQLPRKTSLVSQVSALLKEEMRSGNWSKWLPGEHELCAELHVSRVTLRAALNQLQREGWVRSSRGRRREIVKVRRHPDGGDSNQVVLLWPSSFAHTHPFAMFWIDSLREQLAEAGYQLVVHVSRAAYSRQPRRTLPALLERMRPAAWVLCLSTEPMQRSFEDCGAPCVIAGSRHAGIKLPSVDTDYRSCCRHAAGQFVAKGHRQLVFLNPASGAAGDIESELGFMEGARQARRPNVQARVVRHNATVTGVCHALDGLLRLPNRPTALLVSWASHVLTTMGYLLSCGLRLPQDMALISRDDDPLLEHMFPSVTRYTTSPTLYARKFSRAVLDLVRGEVVAPVEHRIIPCFVPGDTLG